MSSGKAKAVMEAVDGLPACCKRIAGTIASFSRVTVASRIVSDVLLIAAFVLFSIPGIGFVIAALASTISGLAVRAAVTVIVKVTLDRLPREEMGAVVELMKDGWTPKTVSSLARAHMPLWMRSRAELTQEADRLAERREIDDAEGVVYDGLDDWPYDCSWAYGEDPHHGLDAVRVMRDQGSRSDFVVSLIDVDDRYGETVDSLLPAECRDAAQEALRLIARLPRTGADDARPSEEKMAEVESSLDAMTTLGGKPFSEAVKATWDEAKRDAEAKRSQAADAGVSEALAKSKAHLEWLASPEASTLRNGVSRLDKMAEGG